MRRVDYVRNPKNGVCILLLRCPKELSRPAGPSMVLFWQVQKHQRSHKREATKSAPYKRTTPEDHQAMEGAGVEGYRPEDWEPEETRQLDELVNQLGVCM